MNLEGNIETERREISDYPKENIFKSALVAAVEVNLPIAFWRLPQTGSLHFIVSFNQIQKLEKIDLGDVGSGFTFSPFDSSKESLFINNDFHCSILNGEAQTDLNAKIDSNSREKEFFNAFYNNLDSIDSCKIDFHKGEKTRLQHKPDDYLSLVELTIGAIEKNHFQKAVPSRRIEISLKDSFDPVSSFLGLCNAYTNAFTSLVSIPNVGTWLGATPEVLLEVEGENVFKTVAIAATQKRDPEKTTGDTAWTQKEIEEQAMVSRYIINCFKKIRLREFEEKGPKTIEAGNLLHLKTEYSVDMTEANFPQLGTVMLDLLHPTSAVAGMPKENVLSFLKENEGFDREFFSGFLGPINIQNASRIFVNLRCMQLFENSAFLYAGAGITEDSVPEKELLETELKFNTLLNVINNKT